MNQLLVNGVLGCVGGRKMFLAEPVPIVLLATSPKDYDANSGTLGEFTRQLRRNPDVVAARKSTFKLHGFHAETSLVATIIIPYRSSVRHLHFFGWAVSRRPLLAGETAQRRLQGSYFIPETTTTLGSCHSGPAVHLREPPGRRCVASSSASYRLQNRPRLRQEATTETSSAPSVCVFGRPP